MSLLWNYGNTHINIKIVSPEKNQPTIAIPKLPKGWGTSAICLAG